MGGSNSNKPYYARVVVAKRLRCDEPHRRSCMCCCKRVVVLEVFVVVVVQSRLYLSRMGPHTPGVVRASVLDRVTMTWKTDSRHERTKFRARGEAGRCECQKKQGRLHTTAREPLGTTLT